MFDRVRVARAFRVDVFSVKHPLQEAAGGVQRRCPSVTVWWRSSGANATLGARTIQRANESNG